MEKNLTETTFDIRQVMGVIPNRYPFLQLDRVLSYVPGQSVIALKNVTINEPYFVGHFPGNPVMPGVMILEALAQACGWLALKVSGLHHDGMIFYFAGVDKARFKRPVAPGDQLKLHATVLKHKRDLWKFAARAEVDGEVVCEAELIGVLREAQGGAHD